MPHDLFLVTKKWLFSTKTGNHLIWECNYIEFLKNVYKSTLYKDSKAD